MKRGNQPELRTWPSSLCRRLIIGGILAVMGVVAYVAVPGEDTWLPPCFFHEATGLYCPGCGNTRALHALVHGDLVTSVAYNVLLIPAIVLLVCLLIRPHWANRLWLCRMVAVVVIVFFVARNLPWVPFVWLAPGALL